MSTGWRLVERGSGAVVVPEVELADGEWSRLWGLQFRASLPPGRGLLLTDTASIHTCFLRFAIDVVMLDRNGVILDVRRGVRPWRVVFAARGTDSVLEVPAGGAEVAIGSALRLERTGSEAGPLPAFADRWDQSSG